MTLQARSPLYTDTITISTTAVPAVRIHRLGAIGKQKLVFVSTADCYVRFGDAAVGLATSSYELYKANIPVQLVLGNDSTHFSILGTGAGTFYYYVESSVGKTAIQDLLGSVWVDEWARESGASANSWRSAQNRTLAKSGTPTFAPDGTNFKGANVIGTGGSNWFLGSSLVQLAAGGTRPYVAFVGRCTAPTSGNQFFLSLSDGTTEQIQVYSNGSNTVTFRFRGGLADANVSLPDSSVHLFECWADGTNWNGAVDGTIAATASSAATTVALTAADVGNNLAGDTPLTGFISRVVVCTSVPNSRAGLLDLVRQLDGF